jgi:hypothetical protein
MPKKTDSSIGPAPKTGAKYLGRFDPTLPFIENWMAADPTSKNKKPIA